MRKLTLSLFALLVTIVAYCGAPQAFNYQAVATGPTGGPVRLKSIALRLSILDGSSTGTLVYQERQTATTDGAGLVNLQIGNGTAISGSFSSIVWSKGAFWMKAEIDTNGGTAYLNVGTVQFLSVPFAQYAERTNLSSQDFPDGFTNIAPIRQDGLFSYVVPSGYTLYVSQISHNNSASCSGYGIAVNGLTLTSGTASTGGTGSVNSASTTATKLSFPLTIPEGFAVTSTSCGTSLVGFTVPKGYTCVLFDLNTGNYTVPAGKVLVIKNMLASGSASWSGYYTVAGMTTKSSNVQTFADAGQTISGVGLSGPVLMMGYLKDK